MIQMELFDEAVWYQPSMWKQLFELRLNEQVIASLKVKFGFAKVKAWFEINGERIEIRTASVWPFKWSVIRNDDTLGTFKKASLRSFQLEVKDEGTYFFLADNFWGTHRKWVDESGDILMYQKINRSFRTWKKKQTIQIISKEADVFQMVVLACIGFFIMDYMQRVRAAA